MKAVWFGIGSPKANIQKSLICSKSKEDNHFSLHNNCEMLNPYCEMRNDCEMLNSYCEMRNS